MPFDGLPEMSVVMPVRDEADHLEGAVRAVLSQEYPTPVEVVLAIAPSSDATSDVAARLARADERIRVVENPRGLTSAGLNAAIASSTGRLVARVDGHCELPAGYLRRAAETLTATGAQVVGGVQAAVGEGPTQRAVAAAMTSRFGVGNATFHFGGEAGPTDTVYLGVFDRDAIRRTGGFDESLVRNQDYELNWRIRRQGGVVWFDPSLRVVYRPRDTLRGLARQYFQYGQWKREVLRRHPRSLRPRQLAAPVLVATNFAAVALAATGRRKWLAVPLAYGAATVVASLLAADVDLDARKRMPAAFAIMHHAWGLGFVVGPRGRKRTPVRAVDPDVGR